MRHTPLLKEYLLITESSPQRYNWVYAERESTSRAKLKAVSQEERLLTRKEYFKNLLGKPPESSLIVLSVDKTIPKKLIMANETSNWDSLQELDTVLKNRKSAKYFLKFWRQENLTPYFSDYAMLSINKTQQRNGRKTSPFPSPRKVT